MDAPEGYRLPKAAADLISDAEANGWQTGHSWGEDTGGSPFVSVVLLRRLVGPELTKWSGDRWEYRITWHNRGLAAGRVRLFGGWEVTPQNPAAHNLPSLKAIRRTIADNPLSDPSEDGN